MCLFFDLRESINRKCIMQGLYIHTLPRTIGIVTLVGDDENIDIFVYI